MTTYTYIDEVVDKIKDEANIKNDYLARNYAMLVLIKGKDISLKDVHDAWAMNMNFRPKTDKCFGHEHLSIVPFDELSKETQNKDKTFAERLRKIAISLGY